MIRFWVTLGTALWLCACSADAPAAASKAPRRKHAAKVTAGSGGATEAPDAGSVVEPDPLVEPTAGMPATMEPFDPAAFKQDDTGMSGLDPDTIDQLKNGSGACDVQISFPYENTAFPGGLQPPIIMWTGAGEAAYAQFTYDTSNDVNYEFASALSGAPQLQIPPAAWNEITRRTHGHELHVKLKVVNAGVVGSCELHWKIAAGNMSGAIYYNTYQAPAPGVVDSGAIMRLSLGGSAEIYKQFNGVSNATPGSGPCYSCHSVSFDGSTMVAPYHDYAMQVFRVERFSVRAATQPPASGTVSNATFGALTPDGKRILAMGNPECTAGADTFPRKPNNFPLVEGKAAPRLLDLESGRDTLAAGLTADNYMWMPQFSPDGTKVVFNHAKPDAMGRSDRRELATMDYDAATNTFSNLKVIVAASTLDHVVAPTLDYSPAVALGSVLACGVDMCGPAGEMCTSSGGVPVIDSNPSVSGNTGAQTGASCTGPCYPAWPFFTPDNKAVVFSMTSEPDFAQAFPGRDKPALSELWYVDLASLQAVRLSNANQGLQATDLQNNYYPAVMPVQVGGYFWVFWTAVRDYGNKLQGRDSSSMTMPAAEAVKKRIWAAAILPSGPAAALQDSALTDPSFPGFYLDGQSESGNVRAFAALNPCLPKGASCDSGLDCCCGYCAELEGAAKGSCTCEKPMCARINDKCTKDSDCCPPASPEDPELNCLGGYCGFIAEH